MKVWVIVALCLVASTGAWAQSAKPTKDWRSCSDGDRACHAFCSQNKPDSRTCTGDCYKRIKECKAEGFYPWGPDGKNPVGPLTKD